MWPGARWGKVLVYLMCLKVSTVYPSFLFCATYLWVLWCVLSAISYWPAYNMMFEQTDPSDKGCEGSHIASPSSHAQQKTKWSENKIYHDWNSNCPKLLLLFQPCPNWKLPLNSLLTWKFNFFHRNPPLAVGETAIQNWITAFMYWPTLVCILLQLSF